MGLRNDIEQKVKAIMDTEFMVTDVDYVPDINDSRLTFGNTGLRFEATVLFIDMRGSTKILNKHNRRTVAKIHMAYLHTVAKISKDHGGEVRSYNGDSMLVFFQGTTNASISSAIQAAMKMKFMIADSRGGINQYLAKYSAIDFGIGIDDSKILCTKVGISGENNRDVFWVSNAVNKAVVLSDNAKSPNHINISKYVYNSLTDNVKYHDPKGKRLNMWTEKTFKYNDVDEKYYSTNFQWIVN
ncbi:hypothetical protein A8709_10200 [Paenibacillus pectinilyticus]|uniref:Guanylate cyclase domain-containing protein n=1 Tax=Paenibacillus pectinilyticus TaxID=512399 RepID=A0A1C1A5Z7_9BACL|nr:adenylate/guanylate cyclase domain-containing protein [Paenibacillus pectinilyticus]OCT15982.1 hypothetical protein A8709_10200 [Paenibacillus pectinilyticus]